MTDFYKVDYIDNLYVDAIVGKKEVLFLSAFGTDTTIKEFIARLSLAPRNGGIRNIGIGDRAKKYFGFFYFHDTARLQKHTGRLPRHSILGELVHLWLYDPLTMEVDYANRRCILLKRHTETAESFEARLWQAVMNLCPVPLLKEWNFLLGNFRDKKWIKRTEGIQIDAYELNFSSEDVGNFISASIREGKLNLPKNSRKESHLSLVK